MNQQHHWLYFLLNDSHISRRQLAATQLKLLPGYNFLAVSAGGATYGCGSLAAYCRGYSGITMNINSWGKVRRRRRG